MANKLKEPGELKPTTIRVDEKILKTARERGIDVAEVMRSALARAVMARVSNCPTCGKPK